MQRYPCAVCGDPATLDAPSYVTVTLEEPEVTQWLGAHASCLRRVFTAQVEVYWRPGADEG